MRKKRPKKENILSSDNTNVQEFVESRDRFYTSISPFDLEFAQDSFNSNEFNIFLFQTYKDCYPYFWSNLLNTYLSSRGIKLLNENNTFHNKQFYAFKGEWRPTLSYGELLTFRQLAQYPFMEHYVTDREDLMSLTFHKHPKAFIRDLNSLIKKGYVYIKFNAKLRKKRAVYHICIDPKGKVINSKEYLRQSFNKQIEESQVEENYLI